MNNFFKRKFKVKEKATLLRRLSFLLKGGLTLEESLEKLSSHEKHLWQKSVYTKLIEGSLNGKKLSENLNLYARGFSSFDVHSIAVGETTGTLPETLEKLSVTIEKQNEIKEKAIGVCIYPTLVLVAAVGMSFFVLFYVMPKILPVFQSLHIELPLLTKLLLTFVAFVRTHSIRLIILLIGTGTVLLYIYQRFQAFRTVLHKIFFKVPLLGTLLENYSLSLCARSLSTLLSKQATVPEALETTARIAPKLYEQMLIKASRAITEGSSLSKELGTQDSFFPVFFVSMTSVGEISGSLPEALSHIAEYYDHEVEASIRMIASAIEPALMIVMGIMVGVIAVAVLSPLYELIGHMHV